MGQDLLFCFHREHVSNLCRKCNVSRVSRIWPQCSFSTICISVGCNMEMLIFAATVPIHTSLISKQQLQGKGGEPQSRNAEANHKAGANKILPG